MATPNPSLERTSTGMALGPRGRAVYHRPRGPSAMPAAARSAQTLGLTTPMFRALRQAFGDPSRSTLVAAAKVVLASPNAPLQESAAAIERLSHEVDSESKALVLAFAANPESHEWLQQVAGEAVAQMLETKTLNIEEITRLTPAAGEVALAILQGTEFGSDRSAVERLKAATAAGAHPAQGRESE